MAFVITIARESELAGARDYAAKQRASFSNTPVTSIGARAGGMKRRVTSNALSNLDPRNFFMLAQVALLYHWQHRYADEARTYDRSLKIVPGHPLTRMLRAALIADWRADIKPYQQTLAAVIAENPGVASDVDDPNYSLCERTAGAPTRARSQIILAKELSIME